MNYLKTLKSEQIKNFLKFHNLNFYNPKYILVYSKYENIDPRTIENYIIIINNKNILELHIHKKLYLEKMLYLILNQLVNDFPLDYIIKCNIKINSDDFAEIIEIIDKFNFNDPGINVKDKIVVLSKSNIPPFKIHNNQLVKKVLYMIENFLQSTEKHNCDIKIQLTEDAINVLKSLSHKSFYNNKTNDKIQKEFSGILNVSEIKNINNNLVITLNIDGNIASGQEDGVSGIDKPFTFHTHPKKTYDIQNVVYAWPSIEDLETTFNLISNSDGIMHLISTLEGIYIISIDKNWSNNNDKVKIDKSNIFYHYEIPYPQKHERKPLTPEEYVYKLNKNKNLPLEIQYFNWNNLKNPINIYTEKKINDDVIYCKLKL